LFRRVATGQGAGRSQRRDSRRRQSPGTPRVTSGATQTCRVSTTELLAVWLTRLL
jgi:hypothetical protein